MSTTLSAAQRLKFQLLANGSGPRPSYPQVTESSSTKPTVQWGCDSESREKPCLPPLTAVLFTVILVLFLKDGKAGEG